MPHNSLPSKLERVDKPSEMFTCFVGQVNQVSQPGVNNFNADIATRVFEESLPKTPIACYLCVLRDRIKFRRRVKTGQDLFRSVIYYHQLQYFFASETDPQYFMFCVNEYEKVRTYYEVFKIEEPSDLRILFSLLYEATSVDNTLTVDQHEVRTKQVDPVTTVPEHRQSRRQSELATVGYAVTQDSVRADSQRVASYPSVISTQTPVVLRRPNRAISAVDRSKFTMSKDNHLPAKRETFTQLERPPTDEPPKPMVKVYSIRKKAVSENKVNPPRHYTEQPDRPTSFQTAAVPPMQARRQSKQGNSAEAKKPTNESKQARRSQEPSAVEAPHYTSNFTQNYYKHRTPSKSNIIQKPRDTVVNGRNPNHHLVMTGNQPELKKELPFRESRPSSVRVGVQTSREYYAGELNKKQVKPHCLDTSIGYTLPPTSLTANLAYVAAGNPNHRLVMTGNQLEPKKELPFRESRPSSVRVGVPTSRGHYTGELTRRQVKPHCLDTFTGYTLPPTSLTANLAYVAAGNPNHRLVMTGNQLELKKELSVRESRPPPVRAEVPTSREYYPRELTKRQVKPHCLDTFTGYTLPPTFLTANLGYVATENHRIPLGEDTVSTEIVDLPNNSPVVPAYRQKVNWSTPVSQPNTQPEPEKVRSSSVQPPYRPAQTIFYSSNDSLFRQPLRPEGPMYLYITKRESETDASPWNGVQGSMKSQWRNKQSSDADTEQTL